MSKTVKTSVVQDHDPDNLHTYDSRDSFRRLPIRHRHGVSHEQSHLLPHLTEPGLVTPLEKILRSQASGLPVPFMAGAYLDEDFSIIDGLDRFELNEFRNNLQLEMEDLESQFHAATKKLAEKDSQLSTNDDLSDPDPKPQPKKKVAPEPSNEGDTKTP